MERRAQSEQRRGCNAQRCESFRRCGPRFFQDDFESREEQMRKACPKCGLHDTEEVGGEVVCLACGWTSFQPRERNETVVLDEAEFERLSDSEFAALVARASTVRILGTF